MSVSSISQSNVLGVDVLLIIFQHLDGEDLVKCEAVCRQWRDILLAGRLWRKYFHRKIKCSSLWRTAQKKLEKNQSTLRMEQYRNICKNILQVTRNWCSGRFKKTFYKPVSLTTELFMAISDDFVAWNFDRNENDIHRRGRAFLDTGSMTITEFRLTGGDYVLNEMVVRWNGRTGSVLEVRSPQNNWIINVRNEEEDGFRIRQMSFGSELLVCYSEGVNNRDRIRIWKMGNPSTLLKTSTCEDRQLIILKVDQQFIVARVLHVSWSMAYPKETLYFISTETLDVFTSLNIIRDCKYEYNRGLLFQYRANGIIRILDLATGTFFNDVHLPYRKEEEGSVRLLDRWASSNSNVIVMGWNYYKKMSSIVLSHLSVYDLEAVKKPNSDPVSHLLYTLQFQFDIETFVMNESVIAFNGRVGKDSVTVLKFANFNFAERESSDLRENPQDNEDVKMRIVRDPCVSFFSY
jgi:F-box-like